MANKTKKRKKQTVSQQRNYPFSSFLAILFRNADTAETFVFCLVNCY